MYIYNIYVPHAHNTRCQNNRAKKDRLNERRYKLIKYNNGCIFNFNGMDMDPVCVSRLLYAEPTDPRNRNESLTAVGQATR